MTGFPVPRNPFGPVCLGFWPPENQTYRPSSISGHQKSRHQGECLGLWWPEIIHMSLHVWISGRQKTTHSRANRNPNRHAKEHFWPPEFQTSMGMSGFLGAGNPDEALWPDFWRPEIHTWGAMSGFLAKKRNPNTQAKEHFWPPEIQTCWAMSGFLAPEMQISMHLWISGHQQAKR